MPPVKAAKSVRPSDPLIIQIEIEEFDPILGDIRLAMYTFPDRREWTDWEKFEREVPPILRLGLSKHCTRLPQRLSRYQCDEIIHTFFELITNYKCVNLDLRTGQTQLVIPTPRETMLPIPEYKESAA